MRQLRQILFLGSLVPSLRCQAQGHQKHLGETVLKIQSLRQMFNLDMLWNTVALTHYLNFLLFSGTRECSFFTLGLGFEFKFYWLYFVNIMLIYNFYVRSFPLEFSVLTRTHLIFYCINISYYYFCFYIFNFFKKKPLLYPILLRSYSVLSLKPSTSVS